MHRLLSIEIDGCLCPLDAQSVRPAMNETVHIENAVLGGGEAGKYLAWDLAQQGRPVVVIERALIGGSCPNIACLPSKNVIRSAKVADLVSRAASYGVGAVSYTHLTLPTS